MYIYIYIYIYKVSYLSTHTGCDKSFIFFKWVKLVCLTKAREPSLPYYLPKAGWKKSDGFITVK